MEDAGKTQDLELKTFLMANGIGSISDIEMVALKTLSYTSLKDLLPASPPMGIPSPPYTRHGSWHEIPIKNPLVKHAAWAYLRPMSTSQVSDERGLFDLFKDSCCSCHCVFGSDDDEGCIGFFRRILDGISGRKTD